MSTRRSYLVAFTGGGLLGLVTAMAWAGQDVSGSPAYSPPDLESFTHRADVQDYFVLQAGSEGPVHVDLQFNTLARKVYLDWYWGETAEEFSEPLTRESTSYSLSFWPTTVRYLGGSKLAVAGKSAVNGQAIIEVWTLDAPQVVTVGTEHFLRVGGVQDKRLAFVSPQGSGVGLVRALWRNLSLGEEEVFAYSFESKEVYGIDLSTGIATLEISPTATVGNVQPEPLLQHLWPSYGGPSRHLQHGAMYSLTLEGDVVSSGSTVHTLYLVDSDEDGHLDQSLAVSADDEEALGLRDAAQWIE
jgi:hypothetical protein